jgi:hypothetical protein
MLFEEIQMSSTSKFIRLIGFAAAAGEPDWNTWLTKHCYQALP